MYMGDYVREGDDRPPRPLLTRLAAVGGRGGRGGQAKADACADAGAYGYANGYAMRYRMHRRLIACKRTSKNKAWRLPRQWASSVATEVQSADTAVGEPLCDGASTVKVVRDLRIGRQSSLREA